MRRLLWFFLLTTGMTGCSFHRADFVADPNGKPDTANLSDAGKTVGGIFRNGPHLGLTY